MKFRTNKQEKDWQKQTKKPAKEPKEQTTSVQKKSNYSYSVRNVGRKASLCSIWVSEQARRSCFYFL